MMSKASVSSPSPARIAVASSVCLVQGRPAAAQIAVVHRRQVVMDQRIAVDAFERGAGQQRGLARNAEHGRALDHQKRPQPLAAAEAGIAHGVHQPLRPRDLVGQQRVGQQFRQQGFGLLRGLVQAFGEIGGGSRDVIKNGSRSIWPDNRLWHRLRQFADAAAS